MSHEKLLDKIDILYNNEGCKAWVCEANYKSLRAVVELHKPINNPNFPNVDEWCWQCADGRGYAKYPCPTIQAIEKELE